MRGERIRPGPDGETSRCHTHPEGAPGGLGSSLLRRLLRGLGVLGGRAAAAAAPIPPVPPRCFHPLLLLLLCRLLPLLRLPPLALLPGHRPVVRARLRVAVGRRRRQRLAALQHDAVQVVAVPGFTSDKGCRAGVVRFNCLEQPGQASGCLCLFSMGVDSPSVS